MASSSVESLHSHLHNRPQLPPFLLLMAYCTGREPINKKAVASAASFFLTVYGPQPSPETEQEASGSGTSRMP